MRVRKSGAYLRKAQKLLSPGSELYSNEALKLMLKDGKRVMACAIKNGSYFDAGNKLDYIKAVIEFALEQPDIKEGLRAYLRHL